MGNKEILGNGTKWGETRKTRLKSKEETEKKITAVTKGPEWSRNKELGNPSPPPKKTPEILGRLSHLLDLIAILVLLHEEDVRHILVLRGLPAKSGENIKPKYR